MNNIFQELQKRGYQITNTGLLYNKDIPETDKYYKLYLSEEERRKDLIQELALVVDWVLNIYDIDVVCWCQEKNGWYFALNGGTDIAKQELFKTPQEATIAAIEYLIENKLI